MAILGWPLTDRFVKKLEKHRKDDKMFTIVPRFFVAFSTSLRYNMIRFPGGRGGLQTGAARGKTSKKGE